MNSLLGVGNPVLSGLNWFGEWFPQLAIRALLAYEFWESGTAKLHGSNWFDEIQGDFPFPFNVIPTDISWFMAMWSELLGSVAILIGLGTRFASAALIILDVVAWYSVHAGNGYNVCDNGYKLPLIYLILFLPLLLSGPGKASLDYLIAKTYRRS